jgi:uncharacterized membrane protein YbhN (UPF0104 family)
MPRLGMPLLRLVGGLVVLALLWQRVGATPFQNGLRAVTLPALAAAAAITAVATVCSAWRWRVIARTLGVGMPLTTAIGAYYRSQFLNSVLPGGVPGDVHRAVAHGRRAGAMNRGLRAATWDRLSGQVLQAVLTALALLLLPSPARRFLPVIVAGGLAVVLGAVLVVWVAGRRERSRPAGVARAVSGDVRHRLLARGVWPQLTLASVVIVVGHTGTFVIAARVAGATAPLGELVALALLVQTAMVIPLSVGGWGVREGAAAWAFGAAGLGAAVGITVTTVFGVLCLAAMAPGAALLLADSARRGDRARSEPEPEPRCERGPRREVVGG